ncbi:MAG: DUF2339 domain-containing protein, partial [Flavisolibacter sp.]
VLVIGLSIGVKYAIDQELISEAMRIILAYAAGAVLFFLSIQTRKKYAGFSAILLSGAMASLYFTTYGAHVYYSMFSFTTAFIIMIILTVYTVYQAISYNRQEIALLGLVGAYGIPFLISKNADRVDLFFLYISLINIAVVFLCIRKAWKYVGRVAQLITWILFIGWASLRADIKMQWIGLSFMIFFFLLFLFTMVLYKSVHKQFFTVNDTYQILLNNLALFVATLFVFSSAFDYTNIAIICLAMTVVTALESLFLFSFWKDEKYTIRNMTSLSLLFFISFIGFNWDGFTVTLLWLLSSVIIFVWGVKMKSVPARMAAMLLMGATLGKLLIFDSQTFSTVEKVIAYLVIGVLLLVVSFFYQKFRQKIFEEKGESDS